MKFINNTIIIGDKGVSKFHNYCSNHKPFIIWREETKHDFGIDGEVELTFTNQDGKLVASGEIIKVQIKSTESENSYMKNVTSNSFHFFPKAEDIEYWKAHNLEVILIIYDAIEEVLYAKKIDNYNLKNLKLNSRIDIQFDKEKNKLDFNKNDFVTRFSTNFKSRINFDNEELLISNLFKLKLPKITFCYPTNFNNKLDIIEELGASEIPEFIVKNNIIYSFHDLFQKQEFINKKIILRGAVEINITEDFLKNAILRTYINTLLNIHFKNYLYNLKIGFNKHFKRFYFLKNEEEPSRYEPYITKTGRSENKKVVGYHEYGYDKFYLHVGFELDYVLISDAYFIITPKYLYTVDGTEMLPPNTVKKYSNYLKQREWNPAIINQLHFLYTVIANNQDELNFSNSEGFKIIVEPFTTFSVNFGIPLDQKVIDTDNNEDNFGLIQTKLFEKK